MPVDAGANARCVGRRRCAPGEPFGAGTSLHEDRSQLRPRPAAAVDAGPEPAGHLQPGAVDDRIVEQVLEVRHRRGLHHERAERCPDAMPTSTPKNSGGVTPMIVKRRAGNREVAARSRRRQAEAPLPVAVADHRDRVTVRRDGRPRDRSRVRRAGARRAARSSCPRRAAPGRWALAPVDADVQAGAWTRPRDPRTGSCSRMLRYCW